MTAPDAFTPIDNAKGRQGWTTAKLSALRVAVLHHALEGLQARGEKGAKERVAQTRRR
jgi:hypothetical protein